MSLRWFYISSFLKNRSKPANSHVQADKSILNNIQSKQDIPTAGVDNKEAHYATAIW